MAVAPVQPQSMSQLQRHPGPSGLAEVLDVILDKGIVIASVDTYLRFAEAVNRLDLTQVGSQETLPEMVQDMTESGSGGKTKGMLEGAKEALFGGGDDDDEDDDSSSSSGSSRSSGSSSRSRSSGGSGSGSGSRSRSSSGSRSRSSGSGGSSGSRSR